MILIKMLENEPWIAKLSKTRPAFQNLIIFSLSLLPQTIKCLLIHPNPESALNEEAGRLLLEDYAEYASRAHLLTEIHAMGGSSGAPEPGDGPQPKKHAGDPSKRAITASAANTLATANGTNGSASGTSSSNNTGVAKKKTDKKRALRRL